MYSWLGARKWDLLTPVFWRLCLTGFTFAQPFLVTKAVAFASAPTSQPYDNYGYGLIGAYAIVYTGIAVCSSTFPFGGSLLNPNRLRMVSIITE